MKFFLLGGLDCNPRFQSSVFSTGSRYGINTSSGGQN